MNFLSRLSLLLFTLGMFSSYVGTCGCHSGRLVQPHQRNCSRNSVFSRVSIVFVSGPVSSFVCITLQKWTIWSHVFWPHCSDKSSTSNMKIDTLSFLGCILAQHPPKVFHPHIHVLFPVSVNLRCSNFFSNSEEQNGNVREIQFKINYALSKELRGCSLCWNMC